MLSLKVTGMTCGGCINAVTRAIQSQDPQAKVQADLATQTVSLETSLSKAQASELIKDAGFPVLIWNSQFKGCLIPYKQIFLCAVNLPTN